MRTARVAILTFAAGLGGCQFTRTERALPGQPTMNELMHRRAEVRLKDAKHAEELAARTRKLNPEDAKELLAKLKQDPQDGDRYWVLVRYYESRSALEELDALRLWYIERQSAGKVWPGNINSHLDPAGYRQGKALWLAHLKRPGAAPEIYERAADYLDSCDRPLAERALEVGRRAYPNDLRWAMAFGRHYAQALLGSGEPLTEYNVFRKVNAAEASSRYAQSVRARLGESRDASVLAYTAQWLLSWGHLDQASIDQARSCIERALTVDPNSMQARNVQGYLATVERTRRERQLLRMQPSEVAGLGASDRLMLALAQMRLAAMGEQPAEAKAREVLDLAAQNRSDGQYGDAIYEANIVLGKAALRRGEKRSAARYLLGAAETPDSYRLGAGFDMNLPRALVDWGQRSVVAEFLDRMAPKATRPAEFRQWAAQIRQGFNPDLLPTFSAPNCSKDPC